MEVRYVPDPVRFKRMNTSELREEFLVDSLFKPGEITLVYSDVDRAIIGSATPTDATLKLEAGEETPQGGFQERDGRCECGRRLLPCRGDFCRSGHTGRCRKHCVGHVVTDCLHPSVFPTHPDRVADRW